MREMKDSGVAWIGEIPDSWSVSKLQYLGDYINGYAFKPEEWGDKGLPIIRIQDLTKSSENPNYFAGTIADKYLIKNGDILVSWAATLDAFIWNKGTGWLNQHIFKAVPFEDKITYSYFFWLIKVAMQFMNDDNKHGIMMQHVTLGVFNSFKVPLPDFTSQDILANKLASESSKVDSLIANQEAQIEKLKVYKQSLITEVVTKGLDVSVDLKDSYCHWLGKVPHDWYVLPLKYICDMQAGKNLISEQISEKGEYPVYGGNGLRGYYSDFNYDGDFLLVGRQGALCGNVHRVENRFWATEHAVVTMPKDNVEIDFLYYLLVGMNLNQFVSPTAAQPGLAVNTMQNIKTCIPERSTQDLITAYLNERCRNIDRLIAIKQAKIEKLSEYKKSLIYEYVTGKKEVIAANV